MRQGFVVGRFFWGPNNPTPWVSFDNITRYREWARDMRKAYPTDLVGKRPKSEYMYVDYIWTASGLLDATQNKEK